MNKEILRTASEKLKQHKKHMIWVLCLCLLAGLVGTSTYHSLTVRAEALAKEPVCGLEEHTHDMSCYSLGERPFVCGLEESEGHFHDESCFDEEGNLICGQEEHEGHVHGDECYGEAEPVLICGKEEHVHTDACYPAEEETQPEETPAEETVTEEPNAGEQPEITPEPEESAKPEESAAPEEKAEEEGAEALEAQEEEKEEKEKKDQPLEFEEKSGNVTVKVSFEDEEAFDEEDMPVTMKVEPIKEGSPEYEAYYNQIIDETKVTSAEKMFLFDITFENKDGKEVEPLKTASVSFTTEEIPVPEKEALEKEEEQINVVHIPDHGEAEILKADVKTTEDLHDDEKPDVAFETDSFSIYGIVYTVDYFMEMDGKTYAWSMEGGTSVSVTDVLISLGAFTEDKAEAFVKDVKDVKFSRPEVLTIENENDVWMIKSLAPFDTEESMTFTLKNGEVFTLVVKDEMQTTSPWNLANEDNTQFLNVTVDSSVTETEQERDAALKLHFTYSLEEDVVRSIDAYSGNPMLVYDMNPVLQRSPLADQISDYTSGEISIGTRKLGTYKILNNIVYLEFTDASYFDGRVSFTGFFDLTVRTDESQLGSDDEYTYFFPGSGSSIPIKYKKTVEEGSKTVRTAADEDGNYTLSYTADINVNSDLDSMEFHDTLGGLQTLDPSSVKINNKPVAVTESGQTFTFDVAAALGTTGVAKGNYKVTYQTKVTREQLEAMASDKTTETNVVTWKINGDKEVPGGETSVEIEKPREPIPVTKTISSTANQPGDTVSYTVTYGKETTELSGFHISDSITDVVIPQGQVTLTYNGETLPISFAEQAMDGSYSKGTVTLYDYTFPEGTAGYGPVTATYTVKLIDAETAKANGVYDTTYVTNMAVEHRQNTSDTKKTTVTYEKEPVIKVDKTVSANPVTEDGKWAPGTVLSYTLTIGDADTDMAGVSVRDVMTDLQVLEGDITIKVGNNSAVNLNDYAPGAIKWHDDGLYSDASTTLFEFNMPNDAGKGPVIITYTTKIIDQMQASAVDVFGEHTVKNTGHGGKQSDGTSGTAVFEKYPIDKQVFKDNVNVNGGTVQMGDTIHYTLTFGKEGGNLAGVRIYDEMTDLQKLSGNVTITKADGSVFTMPAGSGQWASDGVLWNYFDDDKYSDQMVRVFNYVLPQDIGNGPITVEYDAVIINEDEANNNGIKDTSSVNNVFTVNNHSAETTVTVEFPKDPKHNPQVRKEFDRWDLENDRVYWNIIVEKDSESAYPIENVTVREAWDRGHVNINEPSQGYYTYNQFDGSSFDITHSVVTTDDGTVLTPGVDYTIDKTDTMFTFPLLKERVHISLAFLSPAKIVDGYFMHNTVRLGEQTASADAKYNNPKIDVIKNGSYTEADRLLKWEVIINPSKKEFADSDPLLVMFEDTIPSGLQLVNYTNHSDTSNPSIYVQLQGDIINGYDHEINVEVADGNIISTDIAAHNIWGGKSSGLNKQKYVVTYYTLLSEEEWDRITSSASGTGLYENHVKVTAGDQQSFEATDTVTVTSENYLNKYDTTLEEGGIVVNENGNSTKEIRYKVDINPNGNTLNYGETLSLTDYISTNMDLKTDSVHIYASSGLDTNNELVKAVEATGIEISYNDDSRLLSLREIPDGTPFVLEYICIGRSQGEDTFDNTATLIGGGSHSSKVSKKHKIQTNDAGVKVDGVEVFLHKIDENDISIDLADAKFQFYECELEIGEMTNPETYPQSYWEELLAKVDRMTAGTASQDEIDYVMENFKITSYKQIGDLAVTDNLGYTQSPTLNEHKLYAWREEEAPEGYSASTEYHYFVAYQHINVNSDQLPQPLLDEQEQTKRKHAAWALDDAAQFANDIRVASISNLTTWTATNIHYPYTFISATKVWENDSHDLFETRPKDGIKLQLVRIYPDGRRENIGTPVAINADKDGFWPSYVWSKLLGVVDGQEVKYTVVEEKVPNYTTSYSDDGEGIASGTITVTNRMIPKNTNIYVKKVFDVQEGEALPSEIKVSLMVIKTDKDGQASEPVEVKEVRLTASNGWKYAFEKLPTAEVVTRPDGTEEAYHLTYTVREDTETLERQGFRYTVSYSDNGEGVLETTEDAPLVITNKEISGSVQVSKTFTGIESDQIPENFRIDSVWNDALGVQQTRILKISGMEEYPDVKVTGSGLQYTWTISGLPLQTEVTFTESGYDVEGYMVTTTPDKNAQGAVSVSAIASELPVPAEFKNTYDQLVDFEFSKIWKNMSGNPEPWPEGKTITVTFNADTATKKRVLEDQTLTFSPTDIPEGWTKTESSDKTKTTFRITGLDPKKDGETLIYYVTEEEITGYITTYRSRNGDPLMNVNKAINGQSIVNTEEGGAELPHTGGPGTGIFTFLGILFIAAAGILFLRRQKNELPG